MMRWTFGEQPLAETVELAAALRRVTSLMLALEAPDDRVRELAERLRDLERELDAAVPSSSAPRVGDRADADGRLYLDHSRDIGDFNPAFPLYDIFVDGDHAEGTVEFPILYEGPPGIVHGGFLAVFFDSVIQHHNCDVGVAGKTTDLDVRFRRPAPLLTRLTFEIDRTTTADRIESTASLSHGGKVCTEARMAAIAGDRSALPRVSPRRQDR
jgi:hypothetical protein